MLLSLLDEIKGYDYTVFDDCSDFKLEQNFIQTSYNYGKKLHWLLWDENLKYLENKEYDIYVFIPSDFSKIDIEKIIYYANKYKDDYFIFNLINDGRTTCWNNIAPFPVDDKHVRSFFTDCTFFTNKKTLEKLGYEMKAIPERRFLQPNVSSGVGHQLTFRINSLKIPIYSPKYSFAYHGDHESTMHKEERIKNPLISINELIINKPIYVGIATMKGREKALEQTLLSFSRQTVKPTEIFVYDNEKNINITDNGKFYKLHELSDCYYFSADDDLYYNNKYVESMIKDIQHHNTIITHHGRILLGLDRKYYGGHIAYTCTRENNKTIELDIAGTGVTAFDTTYFHPKNLHKSLYNRMSDITFSLEVAKQQKKIILTPHKNNLVLQLPIDNKKSCHFIESKNQEKQIKLCNEICILKNKL